MIISGKYICISKYDKDIIDDDRITIPDHIWFNLENIRCLSCYDDGTYKLIFDLDHVITISGEAASKLIDYMRKDRDEKTQRFFENLTDKQKKIVIEYMKEKVRKHKENKEEPCTEE